VFITRWRSGSRRTSRRRLRGCAWCSGRPSNRSGSWQLRRDGRCGLWSIERRIQQQRVLTQQAATRSKNLDENIEVGRAYGLCRRNSDKVLAVSAQTKIKCQGG